MELQALQNDGETLTNSCQSFWGMISTHQVFYTCDDPSEKVWIITCTVNELTNEHVGIALFHSQYSGFSVRGVTGFSVHLHYWDNYKEYFSTILLLNKESILTPAPASHSVLQHFKPSILWVAFQKLTIIPEPVMPLTNLTFVYHTRCEASAEFLPPHVLIHWQNVMLAHSSRCNISPFYKKTIYMPNPIPDPYTHKWTTPQTYFKVDNG